MQISVVLREPGGPRRLWRLLGSGLGEGVLQIRPEVFGILEADGDAEKTLGDARRFARFVAHAAVGETSFEPGAKRSRFRLTGERLM